MSVTGTHSGLHPGRLQAYSQGDGASFLPDTAVRARGAGECARHDPRRGSIGGHARREDGRLRISRGHALFDGERSALSQPASRARGLRELRHAAGRPGPDSQRHDRPIATQEPVTILTTNGPGPGQYGPLIYTPHGKLVWFDRLPQGQTAENLSVQRYEDHPALTFWRGKVLSLGFGQGEDVVLNSAYQTIAKVPGGNGLQADLHDFQIAPGGCVLHDRLQSDPLRPLLGRRGARRGDPRHLRPGDRHENGSGALGMAQPRPRGRFGVRDDDADQANSVGLVSRQLDRRAAWWEHFHLGTQYLGRLPDRRRAAATSCGAWAA